MNRDVIVCVIGQTPMLTNEIRELINKEPGFVLGNASGLVNDALAKLNKHKVDVVLIAVGETCHELKGIIETVQRANNAPIIVLGGSNLLRQISESSGAYEFLYWIKDPKTYDKAKRDLMMRIRLASAAKAVAPMKARTPNTGMKFHTGFTGVLALGASCGGTDAIYDVVRMLPPNIPGMAVVQHMPPGFTGMYAERLDRDCAVKVVEATGVHKMEQGKVLLAPGDMQMRVIRKSDGYYTECFNGEKVSGHKPSVDVLFSSVAKCAGRNAVGIILTGMGSDGANGLLEMRRAGAYTIGQDESSSVVYGMPKVAFEKGAVQNQVPLKEVAHTLLKHLMTIR